MPRPKYGIVACRPLLRQRGRREPARQQRLGRRRQRVAAACSPARPRSAAQLQDHLAAGSARADRPRRVGDHRQRHDLALAGGVGAEPARRARRIGRLGRPRSRRCSRGRCAPRRSAPPRRPRSASRARRLVRAPRAPQRPAPRSQAESHGEPAPLRARSLIRCRLRVVEP